ncbi:hypothetical protein N801_07550 [Knoellia aerolata DSM 18566]|uniref:Uncharacterized protein n=1 Tax=Knoellia aerolata DSM 18566 TaxID=1385519 RepID=A0A0A0K0S5_9MICO|nr:hypothetical protein N801_07550 [Knoellia aerolata DSM 18566]
MQANQWSSTMSSASQKAIQGLDVASTPTFML